LDKARGRDGGDLLMLNDPIGAICRYTAARYKSVEFAVHPIHQ